MKKWIQGVAVGLLLSSLLLFIFAADNKPVNEEEIKSSLADEQLKELASLKEENNLLRLEVTELKSQQLDLPPVEETTEEDTTVEASEAEEQAETETQLTPIQFASGETTSDLASKLAQMGFISSENEFLSLLEETGKAGQIRTGTYQVSKDMSIEEIAFVFIRRPSSY
ncbi:endolytic transglycosylase MltG [Mangrovibacillus cuniculi]|uniref:Endolytic transglycosylase MltG n=1 Tax=Mangrovibacillus cuniculi TaxID=2593652 RepID=A0A7S8HFL9_9BACI|nr:endolytic transglycosylase MltG [Mangrovibacillus cuniculi]QPC46882.1 endolytic transglycosylase MltG [Mangrovibacillus cuniculi]